MIEIDFGKSQWSSGSLSGGSTQLVVTGVPSALAAGTVDITVTTNSGTTAISAADQYTYTAVSAPTVTGLAPPTGPDSGGTSVTISGTNLDGVSSVTFGGTEAESFSVNGAGTSITAVSPPGTGGVVDVLVSAEGGPSALTASDHFTYPQPVPTVTSVVPNSGPEAGGGSVTINGTGFIAGATVKFGSTSASVNSITPTAISAVVPASVSVTTVDVTVMTTGGPSTTSSADHYSYQAGLTTPTTPIISNLPASGAFGGGFTAVVTTNGDGTKSVTSNSPAVCTVSGLSVSYVGVGSCSLTAHVAMGTTFAAADGSPQTFTINQATPTTPTISNLPGSGTFNGGFTATVATTGDGVTSVTSNSTSICTATGLVVSYVGVGLCSLTAHVAAGTDYAAAAGGAQTFTINRAAPTAPVITNLPTNAVFNGNFNAAVSTTGDGTTSVTSNSTSICTASGLAVTFVGVGTCSLTAHVGIGTHYAAADGSAQTFQVSQAVPTTPTVSNLPASGSFGGGFTATVATNGDGTKSVTSGSPSVCTATGTAISYVGLGTCSLTAHVAAGTHYSGADGIAQTFQVSQATPSTPSITNLPGSGVFGGGFTATVTTTGDGAKSVTSNSPSVCTASGLAVTYVGVGSCSLTAHVAAGTDFTSASGTAQMFTVNPAVPTTPSISNLPSSGTDGGGFTVAVSTTGDGSKTVTSNSLGICTVSGGLNVSFVGTGTCSLTAHVADGTDFSALDGSAQTFQVIPVASTPQISNLPSSGTFGGGFMAVVATNGDGAKSVTSNAPGVCTAAGLTVTYVGVGSCSLTAHVAQGTNFGAADGSAQTFTIGSATPSAPAISDLPASGTVGGGFTAAVATTGDGATSVSSSTPAVCTSSGLAVSYVGPGTCTLTAHVGSGPDYGPADGSPQSFSVNAVPKHGYWLVGSDGGIFSFGSANFFGSTGAIKLNRPVVGITPTSDRLGYWLVASDGGIFAFGSAPYVGSIPGLGLAPAGTVGGKHLNAPIVGMVPSANGAGYFMVASDGGVFAFNANYEGSCPGIGGCVGAAVGVAPDASGNGYWLVTSSGHLYTFGDAPNLGSPGPQSSAITSIVRTPDGGGYWILDADGQVFAYGDAPNLGGIPPNQAGGLDPAAAIFATSDGAGYWVSTALGKVYAFGDAPKDGDVSGTKLNGSIIAATGF